MLLMWNACVSLQKCKVNIWFSPTLSDDKIRQEAMNLIVAQSERKGADDQQWATESEQDRTLQESILVSQRNLLFSNILLCLFAFFC